MIQKNIFKRYNIIVKKLGILLMVLSCLLSGFGGILLYNADFSIYSFAPREERSVEPIIPQPDIEFDDSVYVEENWNDKASESYAGGNGTKENPYQISNAAEFAHLSVMNNASENNVKGKYFIFTKDIYLNDGCFEENGTYHDGGDGVLNRWVYNSTFSGNLDGHGYNVYGLYCVNNGLFANGNTNTTINNMHTRNSFVSITWGGGFFTMFSGTLINSSFDGIVFCNSENRNVIGGFTGHNSGSIIDCINYGKILGNNKAMQVGGLVGMHNNGKIENCKNYGQVGSETTRYYVGGIAGVGLNIVGCINYGIITAGNKVGGIVGVGNPSHCKNYGKVFAGFESGGIAGMSREGFGISKITMAGNKNFGYVYGKGRIGGIVGQTRSTVVINCENHGKVVGMGGIVGVLEEDCIISDCINTGVLLRSNEGYTAGICGRAVAGSIVQYCESYGSTEYKQKTIIAICESALVYNCISHMTDSKTGNVIKQIYATDLSQFSLNFKTGKIILNKGTALSVFMGSVDRELLISKGFEILS